MSRFTVRGRTRARNEWSPFETEVEADNEEVAIERCYANLGSRHGLRRNRIEIEEVEAR